MDKKRIVNDIILVVALLALALAAWGVIRITHKSGDYAVVEIAGEETARYPLNEDIRIDIEAEGGHVNTFVISDGKAYVESADCPDKLCVKQHAVSRVGETIICLPHKLVIRIVGEGGVDTAL
ncbi:MAG: NusG domain II-containing protein [Clostridia bacterium]|nr:NusG domain II-containing protein [Clostridia bacterium]